MSDIEKDLNTIEEAGFDKHGIKSWYEAGKDWLPRTTKAHNLVGGLIGKESPIYIGTKLFRIDGKKSRILISDGADNRILLGKRENGTFGISVSPTGMEVIGAALASMLYDDRRTYAGDVSGPASATDNAVVRFDETTGKLIQDSGVLIDDSDNVSGMGTLACGVITQSGATLANTYVDIAGDTMTGALTVDGSADAVQLTVQANGTQTTNIQEWENSSAALLSGVDPSGDIFVEDAQKYLVGTGRDGEIYSSSDDLYIANATADKDIIFLGNDSDGGGASQEILRLDASTQRVGIGYSSPSFPLSFGDGTGNKIALWDNGSLYYGLGIQSNLLEIFGASAGADITFGYGASGAIKRVMTIEGTGNVGIGVTYPDTKLEVLYAGNQLKLSFDGTDNATFGVDTSGDLTITASGDEIKVADWVRHTSASYRRYFHLPMSSLDPGASGATWTNPSANSLGGWHLDVANEILYTNVDIHSDWDGVSDLRVALYFVVDDATTINNDTADIKLVCYYNAVGDTATKTQTAEEAITTDGTQWKMYAAEFTIDYNAVDNVVESGDQMMLCFNLETDTSEVDSILMVGGSFFYNTTHLGIESGDT